MFLRRRIFPGLTNARATSMFSNQIRQLNTQHHISSSTRKYLTSHHHDSKNYTASRRFFATPPNPQSTIIQPLPTSRRETLRQRVPFPSEALESTPGSASSGGASAAPGQPIPPSSAQARPVIRVFGKDTKSPFELAKPPAPPVRPPPPTPAPPKPPAPAQNQPSPPPPVDTSNLPKRAVGEITRLPTPPPGDPRNQSPEAIATLKTKVTKRRRFLTFFRWVKWISIISGSVIGFSIVASIYMEHLRNEILQIIPPIFWPEDFACDLSQLGYLDNYNSMMLEQLITLLQAQYLAHMQPTLAPQWMRDLVTENGHVVSPLRNQSPETLLQVLDILSAAHGIRSGTTFFAQLHEMHLRQIVETALNPDYPQPSWLTSLFLRWAGTGVEIVDPGKSLMLSRQADLEAFNAISRMDVEATLCTPLVREELHKRITALLVPPASTSNDVISEISPSTRVLVPASLAQSTDANTTNETQSNGQFERLNGQMALFSPDQVVYAANGVPQATQQTSDTTSSSDAGVLSSIMGYLWWNSGSDSQTSGQQFPSETTNEPWLHPGKSPQYHQLQRIIRGLVGEGPLSPLARDRFSTVSRVFRREGVPFATIFNTMHYNIQQGRRDTLLFVIRSLCSYETTLAMTPHKIFSHTSDRSNIISVQEVRDLISFSEECLQQQQNLLVKYRLPITELSIGLIFRNLHLPSQAFDQVLQQRQKISYFHQEALLQAAQKGTNPALYAPDSPLSTSPSSTTTSSLAPTGNNPISPQEAQLQSIHQLISFSPNAPTMAPPPTSYLMTDQTHTPCPEGYPLGTPLIVPRLHTQYPSV